MAIGRGALEENICACAYVIQSIKNQQSTSLEDVGSLHKYKSFEESPQTLVGMTGKANQDAQPVGSPSRMSPDKLHPTTMIQP